MAGSEASRREALSTTARLAVHHLVNFANGVASGMRLFETYIQLGRLQAPPEVPEMLRSIGREAGELQALLVPLITGGVLVERCGLGIAIGAAQRLHEANLQRTGFVLEVANATAIFVDLPFQVLVLALAHLIENAIKAMEASGKGSSIIISLQQEERGVECVVRDDGPGIDPSAGDVFRAGDAAGESAGGGWGLHLTRGTLCEYDADIAMTGTGPAGTEFTLYLPSRDRRRSDGQSSSHGA